MRRLPAILLLLILLFNLVGYRAVIISMQHRSEKVMDEQVDRSDYNDENLISVKTTLHLPYYKNSPDYERAYGAITIDGKEYAYVKRRVFNDTLELLCLPNNVKTTLKMTAAAWAHGAADGPSSLPFKKNGGTSKIDLPELFYSKNGFVLSELSATKRVYAVTTVHHLPCVLQELPEQPPQARAQTIA